MYLMSPLFCEKGEDTIQGRTLYKGGHYLRKYGIYYWGGFEVDPNISFRHVWLCCELTCSASYLWCNDLIGKISTSYTPTMTF